MTPNPTPALPSPNEIRRQTENMRKLFESVVDQLGHVAKLLKASYDALIQEGFSEAQALEIIKARGYVL